MRAYAAAGLLAVSGAPALSQSTNLYDGTNSVTVDFVDKISSGHKPTVQLGFDDSSSFADFTMDTGSVGILASSHHFQPGPDSRYLGEGSQYYSSDHKTEYGKWYEATQKIYSGGELVAEARVPVLLVTHSKTCDANGQNCNWDYSPNVKMMGIGFAREGADGQTDPHRHGPAYNAFLNLTKVQIVPGGPLVDVPADWHNGYVVSADDVQLGLMTSNTTNAGFIKLAPNQTYFTPTNKEWSLIPVNITAGGQPVAGGTVLMDTGFGEGILTPTGPLVTMPCPTNSNIQCVQSNTDIAVAVAGNVFGYAFEVDGATADSMRPPEVQLPGGTSVFFNTGYYVFNGINLIFDAENGFAGFQYSSSGGGSSTINVQMAIGGSFETPDGFYSDMRTILFKPSTLSSAGEGEFAAPIEGAQPLTIDGPGTVVLSAVNTYSGPTTVVGGTLSVNGTIISDVTVDHGGTLGGTGTINADVAVQSGGVLAPGNSIGTQFITGALSFGAGGIFEVEVNAAGLSDEVVLTGTIDLTGAVLSVVMEQGNYGPSTSYVIVYNDGGDPVQGRFSAIYNPYVFFLSSVQYDAGDGNDVQLTIVPTRDYSYVAQTRNEYAVATALETFPANNPIVQAMTFQTLAGALQAFNALSGEVHGTTASVLSNQSHYVRDALIERLAQGASAPGVVVAPAAPMGLGMADGNELERSPPNLAFWSKAYGAWGDFGSDGNAATASTTIGGVLSGADARLGGDWRAGFATGYSQSGVRVGGGRQSNASVDTVHAALYAGGSLGPVALRTGAAWGWNSIDTTRAVSFPGFFEVETASYNSHTAQAFGELALPHAAWGIAAEPFAGLAFVNVATDAFREDGAAAALVGGNDNQSVGYSTLGVRLATTDHLAGIAITPHFSAAWQHAFGDVTPEAALAFASTGTPFTIAGAPLAQDSALIEATLGIGISAESRLAISYFGQFASDVQDNAVEGRLNWHY